MTLPTSAILAVWQIKLSQQRQYLPRTARQSRGEYKYQSIMQSALFQNRKM
jgi:hypothetical protein